LELGFQNGGALAAPFVFSGNTTRALEYWIARLNPIEFTHLNREKENQHQALS